MSLPSHYKKPWDWSEEECQEISKLLEIYEALEHLADLETHLVNLNLLTEEYQMIFKQINSEVTDLLLDDLANERDCD